MKEKKANLNVTFSVRRRLKKRCVDAGKTYDQEIDFLMDVEEDKRTKSTQKGVQLPLMEII